MHDDQQPRRVVPRWRTSKVTAKTNEAVSLKVKHIADNPASDEVDVKLREFSQKPSVPIAAELMFLASVSGNSDAAMIGAKAILDRRQEIGSNQLVKSAQRILGLDSRDEIALEARAFVKKSKEVLRLNFRNPILLIDVARELTAMRQNQSALKYVKMAQSLAPNSRFVTRSAARYFLHVGEHAYAHKLLKESPLLPKDSWIQASEIAVATVRGRVSNLAKQKIRQLLDLKTIGHDLSELATALGTVEMMAGGEKNAKKLFKGALTNPNDNSLAQAEWAATRLNLVVDSKLLETPFSYEANSQNAYRRHQLDAAIDFADKWATDEPFASRPMVSKCYFLSLTEQYDEALIAGRQALELDPQELSPALNYFFTRVLSGDLKNATEDLLKLGTHADIKSNVTQYLANAGALAYAMQDFETGRMLYQRAIRNAQIQSEPASEALARAFFARMANNYGDPQAPQIISESFEIVPMLPSSGALFVMKGLVDKSLGKTIDKVVANRNPKQRWEWNSLANTIRIIDPM